MNSAYQGGAPAGGFSKYMAFYSKCFVVGATSIGRGVVVNNAEASGLVMGACVTTNSNSLTTAAAAISNGMCSWHNVFNIPDRVQTTNSVDVSRFLNKPRVLDDPQLFCTTSADPTQVVVLHLFVQSNVATAGAILTTWTLETYFDCIFTDPIPFT